MKICIVGHFGKNERQLDGQTIKTHAVFDNLIAKYGRDSIAFVDTCGWKKRIIKLINECRTAAKKNDDIIIMPASRGAKFFVPLFVGLKKKHSFNLHYVLIGGRIYAVAKKSSYFRRRLAKVDYIYAENSDMMKKLGEQGIENVYYMPNFKDLKKSNLKKTFTRSNELHCCIFSRIEKEKGILDAIDVIEKYNSKNGNKIFLDIYGRVENSFKDEFKKAISKNEFIKYIDAIDPYKSVGVIERYDLLLFPTRYRTEGVPGTIIDAYFAGTPVLASRWDNFDEIIDENETGFGYSFGDINDFYNRLSWISSNKKVLKGVSKRCLSAADRYTPNKTMSVLYKNIDKNYPDTNNKDEIKIPKKIHYCWFGDKPLPEDVKKNIASWKKFCPDYEIIEWNEKKINVNSSTFMSEAYRRKKWAFVSDYVRLCALCEEGGIYMDTDVELIKPLDPFLTNRAFLGFESLKYIATGVMACEKEFPLFKEFLSHYEDNHFAPINENDGVETNVVLVTGICRKHGLKTDNELQKVCGATIYPSEVFSPKDPSTGLINITDNTVAIHYYSGSWLDKDRQKRIMIRDGLYKKYGNRIGRLLYRTVFIPYRVGTFLHAHGFKKTLKKIVKKDD